MKTIILLVVLLSDEPRTIVGIVSSTATMEECRKRAQELSSKDNNKHKFGCWQLMRQGTNGKEI